MKVCILSFNHQQLTSRCVNSVLQYTEPSQVLLVHNGTRPEVVFELQKEFPRILHLQIKDNCGFTGGSNRGLQLLFKREDWVFFITNDCELLSPLRTPNSRAFVAPLIYKRRTQNIDSIGGAFHPGRGQLLHMKSADDFTRMQPPWRPYIPGTAFYLHREIFLRTGGFDERLQTYWEDVDFSQRARELGYELRTDPLTILRHGIGKTCHKNPFYTRYLFQRNRWKISNRYATPMQKVRLSFERVKMELKVFN